VPLALTPVPVAVLTRLTPLRTALVVEALALLDFLRPAPVLALGAEVLVAEGAALARLEAFVVAVLPVALLTVSLLRARTALRVALAATRLVAVPALEAVTVSLFVTHRLRFSCSLGDPSDGACEEQATCPGPRANRIRWLRACRPLQNRVTPWPPRAQSVPR